jgi:hypothetical protein
MKIRLCLLALLVASLALLGHTYQRARTLQRTLEFQTSSLKSLAASHAHEQLSRGTASYFIVGLVRRDYVDAFAEHFKEYGITPVATGCMVTEPQRVYSQEYNRVIRESLIAQHGRDLVREFDKSWSADTQSTGRTSRCTE